MARFPTCAFWDFSLDLYARPGVAERCLRLQARHGADVNLLLFALFLAAEGQRVSRREILTLMESVKAVHEQVVRPLRGARTALKAMLAEGASGMQAAIAQLRADVKRSELDAEHLEQLMLAAARPKRRGRAVAASARAGLALDNARIYLAAIGAVPSADDEADLAALATALLTAKREGFHGVARIAAKAGKLRRKRPLATAGGGA